MEQNTPITVETIVHAPIEKVWKVWNDPEHIVIWSTGSPDWHTPSAENDLRVGGQFKSTMAAKDSSASFDFVGTYTDVKEHELIKYEMPDGRKVSVSFTPEGDMVKIVETFDPETENTIELQRTGWQGILDNFKKHVESI
ncbi:MAG TPA: SRPBCC family protein [Patescibacteria group bacterium]|nr:SRPBCC family protein [Patescibacteria group bacterium]